MHALLSFCQLLTVHQLLFSSLDVLSCVHLFVTPWTVAHQSPLSMGFFSSKNIRVGCHFLLQGIFPTQILNLGLLHCRQILYCLSYQRSPLFIGAHGKGTQPDEPISKASWLLFGNLITKVLCTSQLVLSRVSHLRNETKMARKELNT